MNRPTDIPTFIPENTHELFVGEKIENGDLKWHDSANEWTEIQTLGYRMVKASQKGLFRRRSSKGEFQGQVDQDRKNGS